jgi:hypothetical protein
MITLATLAQATAQEVFDQCAVHLLTQNERSLRTTTSACAYRGDTGLACAAGCLIGDIEYIGRRFESFGWGRLVAHGRVPEAHQHLIGGLQRIHDCYEVHQWRDELYAYADNAELSNSVLEQFKVAA